MWLGNSAIIARRNANYTAWHATGSGCTIARTLYPTRPMVLGMTPMNAPTVDDQFGFSLGDLTYIDSTYDDEAASTIVRVHTHRFAHWFSRLLPNVAEWQRRRAVMQEMAMMTDRELSDIGLSRADIARIFDPSFAASRARGRDYIAY
jgi:uncharacterized protein YjiS (DUF1127 family)